MLTSPASSSPVSWSSTSSTPLSWNVPVVSAKKDRERSAHRQVVSPTPVVSLIPDMRWLGCSTKQWVARYAQHVGGLPHIVRVVRLRRDAVAMVELRVDANGYGQVRRLRDASLRTWESVLFEYADERTVVIVDADLQVQRGKMCGICWQDDDVHQRAAWMCDAGMGVEFSTWKGRVCEDLQSHRALRLRVALERLRGEMVMGITLRCAELSAQNDRERGVD